MKTALLSLFVLVLGASAASASVTINFQLGAAFKSDGSPIPAGSIGILVANTGAGILPTAAEFEGATLSAGSFIGDARILGVSQASDITGSGDIGFNSSFSILDLTGLTMGSGSGTAGTDLAFYWFPGISTPGATVEGGASYGFFRNDVVDTANGSQMSFNMPSDGGNFNLFNYDTNLGGQVSPADLRAVNTVTGVPEPSRLMLLGLAGMGLIFRRRRC